MENRHPVIGRVKPSPTIQHRPHVRFFLNDLSFLICFSLTRAPGRELLLELRVNG